MSSFLEFLKILPIWVVFAASILQTGRLCLGFVRYPFRDECEEAAYTFGVGAVFFATGIWITGAFFILSGPVILVLSAIFVLVLLFSLGSFFKWARFWFQNSVSAWPAISRWEKLVAVMSGVSLTVTILAVGSPLLGRDALAYHFYCPKWFLRQSTIGPIPYSVNALQPLLEQMLFLQGLVLGSETFAKLYNLGFLLLTASLWISAGRYAGGSSTRGILGAALLFLIPGWMAQTPYAYNDIALSFFLLLSFFSLYRFFLEKKLVLLMASGFFSGAAAATKILAWPFIAALVILLLHYVVTERPALKIRSFLIFVGFLLLPCFGWYLRAFLLTGNPIFPYWNHFFNGVDWASDVRDQTGIGRSFFAALKAPFLFFLDPDHFGSGDSQPGILVLAVAPLILTRSPIRDRSRIYFILGFLFLTWFYLVQHYRFIFSAFALLALLAAGTLEDLFRSAERRWLALKVTVLLLAALQMTQIVYYNGKLSKYLLFSSRESYLTATERSYGIASWVNHHVGRSAYLWIHNEPSQYYFEAASAREDIVRGLEPSWTDATADEILRRLKDKGFTHLLDRQVPDSLPSDSEVPVLVSLLKDPQTKKNLEMIHQQQFLGPEGASIFKLYRIRDE